MILSPKLTSWNEKRALPPRRCLCARQLAKCDKITFIISSKATKNPADRQLSSPFNMKMWYWEAKYLSKFLQSVRDLLDIETQVCLIPKPTWSHCATPRKSWGSIVSHLLLSWAPLKQEFCYLTFQKLTSTSDVLCKVLFFWCNVWKIFEKCRMWCLTGIVQKTQS